MSSTNNFTNIHVRDFVNEVSRDPTRPGYDSALQLHTDINIPPVHGEELSDDFDIVPIPALIRFFAPTGQMDLYQPSVFVYATGPFNMNGTQDAVPQMVINAFSVDW
jgi:hypothetical protein